MNKQTGKSTNASGLTGLFFVISFSLLLTFLWGRVHIDFVLRELDDLSVQKQTLLREIDDLQVEINALQQYQRIVTKAREQGLVFVEQSKRQDLAVDFTGLKVIQSTEVSGIKVAGLGALTKMINKSSVSPYQEKYNAE